MPFRICFWISLSGRPIDIDTAKRSSWLSGRSKVPINSRGFWVATTRNGSGKSRVSRSMVTRLSSMASSREDCSRRCPVQLISKQHLGKHRPLPKVKAIVSASKTDIPVISAGADHWCIEYAEIKPEAGGKSARVRSPLPGASSISTCRARELLQGQAGQHDPCR